MREALELAERGRGKVEPNPMVGCVIEREGEVIGRGWHKQFGGPHAEVHAVRDAGGDVREATVYVTLEPCCHMGQTPPCTELLIEHEVGRVVAAMQDPAAHARGRGLRALREAGIRVDVGLLGREAHELNAPYVKLARTGRPYVIAKWAMTLDGRIATKTGDSKWISSKAARRLVHRIRGEVSAVIVGIGTVLADDPELTCRVRGGRQPVRVVLDAKARLPIRSRLLRAHPTLRVVAAVSRRAPARRVDALGGRGCDVVEFEEHDGRVEVGEVLDFLGSLAMSRVLVEGGAEVLGSFFDAGEVDEVMVFVGPQVVGAGRPAVLGTGVERLGEALSLASVDVEPLGDSVLIRGRIR
jgi:diaminohydroxyphosphoribosylaminopyrimidine deaminase/5-amino-6-(5-phosphoribosylamino)uracil reductase